MLRSSPTGIDLYWLPLGAGGHSVRVNGKVFEAVAARLDRRAPCDLYHSALIVRIPGASFVVADSAQFSAMVTESVPPHAIGTALTIQISLGFLLTAASIQLVPPIVDALGWRWALAMLALGPAAGIASIRRLVAWRAAGQPTGHGRAATG